MSWLPALYSCHLTGLVGDRRESPDIRRVGPLQPFAGGLLEGMAVRGHHESAPVRVPELHSNIGVRHAEFGSVRNFVYLV
jgi:hypothetical protein